MQAKVDTMPGVPAASSGGKPKTVKMAAKLAYRNLFHDRLSLAVTLTGIVFSVVLVAVQCGLYIGSERTIAAMLDQAQGDLWVVPLGTKSFDDPSLLTGREKYAVLSTPGVAERARSWSSVSPAGASRRAARRRSCLSGRTGRTAR